MDIDALSRSLGPIQEAMKKAEAERHATTLAGSAGGGAVQVVLKGDLSLTRVTIAPAAAAACAADPAMLQDLVLVAVNDALRQYRNRFGASAEEQLQKSLAGGGALGALAPLMSSLGRR